MLSDDPRAREARERRGREDLKRTPQAQRERAVAGLHRLEIALAKRRLNAARRRLEMHDNARAKLSADIRGFEQDLADALAGDPSPFLPTTPRLDSGEREEVRRARDLQPWDDA